MTATLSEKLDQYFELVKEVHEAFGYVEDWVVIPLDDNRESYWRLSGEGRGGEVAYSPNPDVIRRYVDSNGEDVGEESGDNVLYTAEIYTQRFLPKWVYRTDDLTMVCVDTHTDGNKFLMIFDNEREVTT